MARNRVKGASVHASCYAAILLVVGLVAAFGSAAIACDFAEIKNVVLSDYTMTPGSQFTVGYEWRGTGPTYPYAYRWISKSPGGQKEGCHIGVKPACQWNYDTFTLTAPSTPGTYTWYVAGFSSDVTGLCNDPSGYAEDHESFTFTVESPSCDEVEIRNVSVSPSTVAPGAQFTVSYEFLGTGPDYPYEYRWISETLGGAKQACHIGDKPAFQWSSDSFSLTAPSTPGTYTWYLVGYGGNSTGYCSNSSGVNYDDFETFTFVVESPPQTCESVEIRNVSVSPASVSPGGQITVSY